jgi:hypothetical protein
LYKTILRAQIAHRFDRGLEAGTGCFGIYNHPTNSQEVHKYSDNTNTSGFQWASAAFPEI